MPDLPPLTLDDIRVAGPDRDSAEAFDPSETWWTACDKIAESYTAADVAALLLDLDGPSLDALADYWTQHTLNTVGCPSLEGRDFLCPDLRLCLALQEIDPDRDAWTCAPTLEPESLWETVRDFDALKDQQARALVLLRTLATHINDGDTQSDPNNIVAAHKLLRDVTGTGLWPEGEG